MFIKIVNDEIIGFSNCKVDDTYVETNKNVILGFDHKLYYEEDTKTNEYIQRESEYQNKKYLDKLRTRRELECFSIVNRGKLWYNTLTEAQILELDKWYKDWLDVTETSIIPEKPSWLK